MVKMEDVKDVEMPSPKRLCVEATNRLDTIAPIESTDDFEDIYGTPAEDEKGVNGVKSTSEAIKIDAKPNVGLDLTPLPGLPGLGMYIDGITSPNPITETQVRQNVPSGLKGGTQTVNMIEEETKRAKRREEQKKHEQTLPTRMDDLEDVTGKSSTRVVKPDSAEEATSLSQEKQPEEHMPTPKDALHIESPPLYNVEASLGDPLALFEASLPQELSHNAVKSEIHVTGTNGDLENSVESPTFEQLATANKHSIDAEFELDSSPLSSDSESSDTSSSDDSDADDYKMLGPEEQARRLMAEDGASDEEGAGGGATARDKDSGPLRTQNEKPDEVVPKPDLVVTSEMKIEELGTVEGIVENVVLIKARTSGEYQVLEQGSVLCLDDRSVIGVVAETLGRVQQPYYSVRFTNAAAIAEAGIAKGTKISYVEQYSTSVFTQPLRAFKGSDASNLHDEEVGDDELEFSDDEAEAEHRRKVKMQRQQKRSGREGQNDRLAKGPRGGRGGFGRGGGKRGGHNFKERNMAQGGEERRVHLHEAVLNYDDTAKEDLYTPLARPTNLHEMMGAQAGSNETSEFQRDGHSTIQSRGRGHADRGGGRGFGNPHGPARGGSQNRSGFHFHPKPPNDFAARHSQQTNTFATPQSPAQEYLPTSHPAALPPQQQQSFSTFQQTQYPPQLNQQQALHYPTPSPAPPQYNNDAYQYQYAQQSLPPNFAARMNNGIPAGAHINPAFFLPQGQQRQQQQHQYHQWQPGPQNVQPQ